jgi:hypothetical protein
MGRHGGNRHIRRPELEAPVRNIDENPFLYAGRRRGVERGSLNDQAGGCPMNRALIVALAIGAVAAGHYIGQGNVDSPGDAVAAPPPELIGATLLEGLGNHDLPCDQRAP